MSPASFIELIRARRDLARTSRNVRRWERSATATGPAPLRADLDSVRLHLTAIVVRSGRNSLDGQLAAVSLLRHTQASQHLAHLERGLAAYERAELGPEDVGTPAERSLAGLAAIADATDRARRAGTQMRVIEERIGIEGRSGGVGQERWDDLRHAFDRAFALLFEATLDRLRLDPCAPDPRRPDGEVDIYRAASSCLDAAEDLVRRQAT